MYYALPDLKSVYPFETEDKYILGTNYIFYIDTDEILGVVLLLKKNHIFIACSEDTFFIFHLSRVRILVLTWLLT